MPSIVNDTLSVSSIQLKTINTTGPTWSFVPGFDVFVTICSLTGNGFVFLTILCTKSLQTPFSIYLLNLLAANFFTVIMVNIADLFSHLYSPWPLGNGYCTVFIYGLTVMTAGTEFGHCLIALNRVWAIYWPHSYRTKHNSKIALLFCASAWVYVAAMLLPGFIRDTLYFRPDVTVYGCVLNVPAQFDWMIVVQVCVFNMGIVVMWVTYPLIWFKRRKSQTVKPDAKGGTGGLTQKPSDPDAAPTGVDSMDPNASIISPIRKEKKMATGHMMLLTVLTVSVTICWTPLNTLYTMMLFPAAGPIDPTLQIRTALNILFSLQSMVDPILFVASLSFLRQAIFNKFRVLKVITRV